MVKAQHCWLPRSAGTDFPNQGLRSSNVSKHYGLLGTRGHSWPEAPPQEHLQNPCSDLAAPIWASAASAQEAQHPWGALMGCRRSSALSTALHSLNYTHRNSTLHLGTHLPWIKGGPKDFTSAGTGWISRFKMLFSTEDDSATPLYTHRTCIASKCFLKKQQPTQKCICMNPSMYRPPALSTASFIALVKSWMWALPFLYCVLKPISCPLLLCECYSGRHNSHSMCRVTHRQTPPSLPWGHEPTTILQIWPLASVSAV